MAFREYYIPAGVLNRKLTEFLDLRQGSMSVMDYVNKFNHLSQYAGTHVDVDEKKRDRFIVASLASCRRSYIQETIRTLGR